MRLITAGATSQSVYLEVLDNTSTTGGRKTGLAFNTSGIQAWYTRNGAAAVQIGTTGALATQTASGAWTSAGFAEVSSANSPGVYRLDVPNAAFAAGVPSVVITIFGATGMSQVSSDVQLTVPDLQAALATPTNITAGTITTVTTTTTATNLTNLPSIPANWLTATGIAASALNGKGDWNIGKTGYTVSTVSDKTGYSLTQTFPTNFSSLGISAGGHISNVDTLTTYTGDTPQTGDSYARIGAAGASLTSVALTSAYDYAKGTVAMTESYAASTATMTPAQALYGIHQYLTNFSIAGTSYTVTKRDKTTTAFTVTLNDVTSPTGASE